ncbi:MarR family winged helix-turn-helix transcriptional regulator [Acinetobacter baumannii]
MSQNDHLLSQLHLLAEELRIVSCRLHRQLRERGNLGDLTPSQVSVVLHLQREGSATVTALAKVVGVRSQSMGATIAALESAGLLESRADPTDKRQTIWSLTSRCMDLIQKNRTAKQDWLLQLIQKKMTEEEQAHLAQSVELLKRLISE